ncbi:ribose-5-phosphate isomerase RpiA [Planococcus sp. CAU13]|uniref:ribose-5-phosphate isomerase RpiA n=1 Tax=Planococcus sp. CAU13 TaxID=1541197 RepID=UPI00052FF1B8|nr:ribose-5-phosphate isomerase RpiA [Planococcus sp. CAU13]
MTENQDLYKKAAAEKAVGYVEDGMVLGLGSGSTVYWLLKHLGELAGQGLNVKGIPSSSQTAGWAEEFGIPLTDFSEAGMLDLAIDGADEIDPNFRLTKGGGGALVREKLLLVNARQSIIIADESKMVDRLGRFPLPVEVLQFAWQCTAVKIAALGAVPVLRKRDGRVFVSDNGNYILDCAFGSIANPVELHNEIKLLTGVVETGLFIGLTDKVILAGSEGTMVINKTK